MDEAAGQGGEGAAVDVTTGMVELPLLRTWAMGFGEGVAAVDKAAGRAGGLPTQTRPRDKGERPLPWTRPQGRQRCLCFGCWQRSLGRWCRHM